MQVGHYLLNDWKATYLSYIGLKQAKTQVSEILMSMSPIYSTEPCVGTRFHPIWFGVHQGEIQKGVHPPPPPLQLKK